MNFGISARIGNPNSPFVIEADEYDTSFLINVQSFYIMQLIMLF